MQRGGREMITYKVECTLYKGPGGVVGDTLACASAAGVAVLFDVPEALFTGAAAALGRT